MSFNDFKDNLQAYLDKMFNDEQNLRANLHGIRDALRLLDQRLALLEHQLDNLRSSMKGQLQYMGPGPHA